MTTSLPATPAHEVDGAIRALLPGAVSSVRPGSAGDSDELVFRVGPRSSVVVRAEAAGWTVAPEAPASGTGAPESEASSGHSAPAGVTSLPLGAAAEAPAAVVAQAFLGFLRAWSSTAVAGEFDSGLAAALNPAALNPAALTPVGPGQGAPFAGPSPAGYVGSPGAVGGILPPFAPASSGQVAASTVPPNFPSTGLPSGRGASAIPGIPSGLPASSWYAAPAPRRMSFTRRAVVIASVVVGSLLVLGGGAAGVSAVIAASVKAGQDSSGSDGAAGTTSVKQLSVGDCFDLADADDTSGKVDPIACSKGHDSELFAIVTVPDTTDDSGRLEYDLADIACFGHYSDYVGTSYNNSNDDYDVLTPSESAWKAGDRQAYCYLTFDDDDKTGSARGSGE